MMFYASEAANEFPLRTEMKLLSTQSSSLNIIHGVTFHQDNVYEPARRRKNCKSRKKALKCWKEIEKSSILFSSRPSPRISRPQQSNFINLKTFCFIPSHPADPRSRLEWVIHGKLGQQWQHESRGWGNGTLSWCLHSLGWQRRAGGEWKELFRFN